MQIVFHLGTHFSDEGRLLRALAANAGPLEAQGCIVPPPARYREPIRELLNALRGAPADATAQETLLDTITEHDDFARLILSHENFMGFPVQVVSPQGFHAQAGQRLQALCNLFPGAETEFFMALVNPATLMPAIVRFAQRKYSYDQIMAGQPPEDLRWAPVVREMLDAIGGRKLVLWCNEDTPLIWP